MSFLSPRGRIGLALVVGGGLVAGAAIAQQNPFGQLPPGYLGKGAVDAARIVAPAPSDGDARYEADRKIFAATRDEKDGARWAMATRDVRMQPPAMMEAFSCAAGVTMTPEAAPKLNKLMLRVLVDSMTANEAAKHAYQRKRPFQIDEGQICQPVSDVASSYDYPSGHTVWGWSWALVLAELAPDRATPILARGRAYGESRVICGAHNASAVEAGAVVAASTFATLHGSPEFRADLDQVRAELADLKTKSPPPAVEACASEAELVAQSPYRAPR